MSSLTIVAIPAQDDFSWNVSSEEVPHLTLLFLGDNVSATDAFKIRAFVEHAASQFGPFGLPVARRGVLGDDSADVVFFDTDEIAEIREFRDNLLKDATIRRVFGSIEQFPEWIPHLTLGYPSAPAKKSDRAVTWVYFDKIAVWDDRLDGATVDLKRRYSELSAATPVDEFLAHYGVPGMKWGKRKAASVAAAVNPKTPRTPEQVLARKAKVKKVVGTTIVAAQVALVLGPPLLHLAGIGMDSAIMAKNTSNANKYAANLMADTMGLGSMRYVDI